MAGALLLHGLGHGGALAALLWIRRFGERDTGGWHAAKSWLAPSLPASTAATTASIFWIVSMIGFVAASMSFLGIFLPGEAWKPIAVVSAIVSALGITAFLGAWPAFNTLAALGVNLAVLVALLWFRWSPTIPPR